MLREAVLLLLIAICNGEQVSQQSDFGARIILSEYLTVENNIVKVNGAYVVTTKDEYQNAVSWMNLAIIIVSFFCLYLFGCLVLMLVSYTILKCAPDVDNISISEVHWFLPSTATDVGVCVLDGKVHDTSKPHKHADKDLSLVCPRECNGSKNIKLALLFFAFAMAGRPNMVMAQTVIRTEELMTGAVGAYSEVTGKVVLRNAGSVTKTEECRTVKKQDDYYVDGNSIASNCMPTLVVWMNTTLCQSVNAALNTTADNNCMRPMVGVLSCVKQASISYHQFCYNQKVTLVSSSGNAETVNKMNKRKRRSIRHRRATISSFNFESMHSVGLNIAGGTYCQNFCTDWGYCFKAPGALTKDNIYCIADQDMVARLREAVTMLTDVTRVLNINLANVSMELAQFKRDTTVNNARLQLAIDMNSNYLREIDIANQRNRYDLIQESYYRILTDIAIENNDVSARCKMEYSDLHDKFLRQINNDPRSVSMMRRLGFTICMPSGDETNLLFKYIGPTTFEFDDYKVHYTPEYLLKTKVSGTAISSKQTMTAVDPVRKVIKSWSTNEVERRLVKTVDKAPQFSEGPDKPAPESWDALYSTPYAVIPYLSGVVITTTDGNDFYYEQWPELTLVVSIVSQIKVDSIVQDSNSVTVIHDDKNHLVEVGGREFSTPIIGVNATVGVMTIKNTIWTIVEVSNQGIEDKTALNFDYQSMIDNYNTQKVKADEILVTEQSRIQERTQQVATKLDAVEAKANEKNEVMESAIQAAEASAGIGIGLGATGSGLGCCCCLAVLFGGAAMLLKQSGGFSGSRYGVVPLTRKQAKKGRMDVVTSAKFAHVRESWKCVTLWVCSKAPMASKIPWVRNWVILGVVVEMSEWKAVQAEMQQESKKRSCCSCCKKTTATVSASVDSLNPSEGFKGVTVQLDNSKIAKVDPELEKLLYGMYRRLMMTNKETCDDCKGIMDDMIFEKLEGSKALENYFDVLSTLNKQREQACMLPLSDMLCRHVLNLPPLGRSTEEGFSGLGDKILGMVKTFSPLGMVLKAGGKVKSMMGFKGVQDEESLTNDVIAMQSLVLDTMDQDDHRTPDFKEIWAMKQGNPDFYPHARRVFDSAYNRSKMLKETDPSKWELREKYKEKLLDLNCIRIQTKKFAYASVLRGPASVNAFGQFPDGRVEVDYQPVSFETYSRRLRLPVRSSSDKLATSIDSAFEEPTRIGRQEFRNIQMSSEPTDVEVIKEPENTKYYKGLHMTIFVNEGKVVSCKSNGSGWEWIRENSRKVTDINGDDWTFSGHYAIGKKVLPLDQFTMEVVPLDGMSKHFANRVK